MMRIKSLLCISLILCLTLVACKGKKEGVEEKGAPEKGDAAVDVTLHDLEGKTVTLSQLKGKVVLLNFWATWCPPCREEMPSMDALYQKFKGTDLVMLPVSVDENAETVRDFMKKNNYVMPVYHDPKKDAGLVYGITGVPETFLVDKNGMVAEKVIGPIDWMNPEVIKTIQDLLK